MKFVNLDESWSFKAKISGSDPLIDPGTVLFLRLFVSCPSKFVVEGQLRIWKTRTKPRSRKFWNTEGQIKHTGIRHGNHIPIGNEILYIDFLGKVIHDDEK